MTGEKEKQREIQTRIGLNPKDAGSCVLVGGGQKERRRKHLPESVKET